MKIYIAEPIDLGDRVDPPHIHLPDGWDAFRPKIHWKGISGTEAASINETNDFELSRSDAVLAILHTAYLTVGVPAEIALAWTMDVPVFVVTVTDWTWLKRPNIYTFPTIASAMEEMKRVFDPDPMFDDGSADYGSEVATMPPGVLEVQRLNDWGYGPVKGYPDDAGFDLTVAQDTSIYAGDFALVPCSIAIASTGSEWFMILGRSSALWKRGLFVPPAVIDNGFRGEIFVGVKNWNPGVVIVKRGERIAQLIPMHTIDMAVKQVETLPTSDRGDKGFGSTGE